MSDYTPEDIVKHSLKGNGADVKDLFKGVLADKVMEDLESKILEVHFEPCSTWCFNCSKTRS